MCCGTGTAQDIGRDSRHQLRNKRWSLAVCPKTGQACAKLQWFRTGWSGRNFLG